MRTWNIIPPSLPSLPSVASNLEQKETKVTKNARNWSLTVSAFMILCLLLAPVVTAADEPQFKFQITGLFMPEREADFRQFLVEKLPDIKLVSIDYDRAEAVFDFDAAKLFPGAKPDQLLQRLDNLVRTNSNSTFGIKPLSTMPREKLERVEIPVAGLDCKACSLALYEIVYRLDGVEQANASFKSGLVAAWIDPAKTSRAVLEEALSEAQRAGETLNPAAGGLQCWVAGVLRQQNPAGQLAGFR